MLTAFLLVLVSPLVFAACTLDLGSYDLEGTSTASGACRYTIQYGVVTERWAWSYIATEMGNYTTTALPPSCPQDASDVVGQTHSEDCLFAVIYAPPAATYGSELPVFVWVHGGSFVAGGASAPGLDGSNLALKGNMIVVVLQYRLGVLGFIPPTTAASTADPNLGLLDVLNGLKAVRMDVPYFGGDPNKVTVGGQSAGASMVRALWGAPSAAGLFRALIMQSDPMTYGFASTSITSQLQDSFYSQSSMSSCRSLSCLQNLSVSDILSAQDNLSGSAPFEITGVPIAEAIRPTYGVSSLPIDPTSALWNSPSSLPSPPSCIPLLITTVKNEGGSATQALLPSPIPLSNGTYAYLLSEFVGASRATTIYTSEYYALPDESGYGTDGDVFRETFELMSTDGTWRCVSRDGARHWAAAGGKVWVGEWRQGVTYVDNDEAGGYCLKSGLVCHEDDIYPTFDNAPNPTSNTTTFETTIDDYWISFITTLDPNPSSPGRRARRDRGADNSKHVQRMSAAWPAFTASSTDADVFPLGGDGEVTQCPEGFWGGEVQYDWQLYG
ncbi:hypothetical protein JCM24511_00205 [Saitozyma sp. JCM 24511]|nr:hypothetical protein JCM24511_00205 [Saitozyma sp. JCM 24511]